MFTDGYTGSGQPRTPSYNCCLTDKTLGARQVKTGGKARPMGPLLCRTLAKPVMGGLIRQRAEVKSPGYTILYLCRHPVLFSELK